MREWYLLLSKLSASLMAPIGGLATSVAIPPVGAFLLGLLGATSPCQLTTNLSAMAYVARKAPERGTWREAVAFTLGKTFVYMAVGGVVILLGVRLQEVSIPVVIAARRALGPLLLFIGLSMVGLIRLKGGALGHRLSAALKARLPHGGSQGAFLMGVAFAFAFCPTLFWLFFGLTIPMGLQNPLGWVFPGLFAVGTAVPLLAFATALMASQGPTKLPAKQIARWHGILSRVAGIVFILAGANDTLTYWAI